MLLSLAERRRVAELFVGAAGGRVPVAVHCGAQSTRGHGGAGRARGRGGRRGGGGDRAAVLPARRGARSQAHFGAAAAACAPLPFYVYEFAVRSGYAVPIAVVERLRETAPNLRGLKVSDKPWEAVEPYLLDGLDVFIGAEALVARGLAAGAAGAVSGLASRVPGGRRRARARADGRALGRGRAAARRARALPVPRRGEGGRWGGEACRSAATSARRCGG